MLYIFTGNGKGKTTAALGQAIRAVGEGKKVLMIQFIKGPWESGEHMFIDKFQIPRQRRGSPKAAGSPPEADPPLADKFKIKRKGKGFVGIMGDVLPREEHEKAAIEALAYAKKEIKSGNWNIVILDEINNAVSLGLISKEKVLEFVESAEKKIEHLIFTGRDAPQEFIDRADLVTEMRDVKHPYQKGIKGKRGLEY